MTTAATWQPPAIGRRVAALSLVMTLALASMTGGVDRRVDVVATTSGSVATLVAQLQDAGAAVTDVFEDFGIVTASVPSAVLPSLSSVAHVVPDRLVEPAGRGAGGDETGSSTAAASIGATDLHAAGVTGAGIGIAVVDTGVDPVGPIGDQLLAGANVVDAHRGDAYGHGTFLAGVLTGDGAQTPGIAPESHLVSIRVSDADGGTSLSGMLRGLATAHVAAEELGVRVVLLAFGVEPGEETVPLAAALRALWADGLVVVVPAGNDGPGAGSLTAPGTDPYLLTVGMSDDKGTADTADDVVAEMSGQGPSADRVGPDLVAPGTSLLSLRSPGSVVDRTYRDARIGSHGFRGSGTSMSAAVAAGAAALLLEQDPTLTPDEVKGRLIDAARPVNADAAAAGSGLLDVAAASTSTGVANGHLPALTPPDWDAPSDDGDQWEPPAAWLGRNWAGRNWAGRNWAGDDWAGRNWAGRNWAGRNWAGRNWAGDDWAGRNWAGRNWAGDDWAGRNWAGRNWAGDDWAGRNWAGRNWAGDDWAGRNWAGRNWAADAWLAADWQR